jgi:hypothetical protein
MLAVILALGCGSENTEMMPLAVGRTWSYRVDSGLQTEIKPVRVTRPVAIMDVEGYELNGVLGVSLLAWRHGVLIQQSGANIRYEPPLPILYANRSHGDWKGSVSWFGRSEPASAEISQRPASINLGARQVSTTQSEVDLKLSTKTIRLITWFESGVGIVKQEQRTNDQLDYGLEMVASTG